MEEIVWKYGEKPTKSLKHSIQQEIKDNNQDDIIKTTINTEKNLEFEMINKRESVDAKLNERQLVGQRNNNPYFSNSSYLADLKTHDNFLIPKNSNSESNF